MTTPETNPYAPPRAPLGPAPAAASGKVGAYSSERRSVLLCIGLAIITLGLYQPIWLLRRKPFLNSLDSEVSLGPIGPILYLLGTVAAMLLAFAGSDGADLGRGISGLTTLLGVILSFRVVRILRSNFRRTGRILEASYGWAFLFGVYYLQYKINQAADTPARIATDAPA